MDFASEIRADTLSATYCLQGKREGPMWRWLLRPAYPKYLLYIFVPYWLAWAFRPVDRKDWLLENILLALFIGLLLTTYRSFPLSNISYTLIFVFFCLHTIGAHYTYSLVPYDRWFQPLFCKR